MSNIVTSEVVVTAERKKDPYYREDILNEKYLRLEDGKMGKMGKIVFPVPFEGGALSITIWQHWIDIEGKLTGVICDGEFCVACSDYQEKKDGVHKAVRRHLYRFLTFEEDDFGLPILESAKVMRYYSHRWIHEGIGNGVVDYALKASQFMRTNALLQAPYAEREEELRKAREEAEACGCDFTCEDCMWCPPEREVHPLDKDLGGYRAFMDQTHYMRDPEVEKMMMDLPRLLANYENPVFVIKKSGVGRNSKFLVQPIISDYCLGQHYGDDFVMHDVYKAVYENDLDEALIRVKPEELVRMTYPLDEFSTIMAMQNCCWRPSCR